MSLSFGFVRSGPWVLVWRDRSAWIQRRSCITKCTHTYMYTRLAFAYELALGRGIWVARNSGERYHRKEYLTHFEMKYAQSRVCALITRPRSSQMISLKGGNARSHLAFLHKRPIGALLSSSKNQIDAKKKLTYP